MLPWLLVGFVAAEHFVAVVVKSVVVVAAAVVAERIGQVGFAMVSAVKLLDL